MLFNPCASWGSAIPGLAALAALLPRKIQEIPGVMHGGLGWQGIIPSRAAKMGSIAVDKGIAKVGSAGDFYAQLEPEKIAEHILATSQRDIRDLVERTMRARAPAAVARPSAARPRGRPRPRPRAAARHRALGHRPDRRRTSTSCSTSSSWSSATWRPTPSWSTASTRRSASSELRFIINFGFFFGFLLGIPVAFIVAGLPALVGPADPGNDRRLRHELAGHQDDLRAGRAPADRAVPRARAVPAPPGRGRGHLREDHLRRRS